MILLAIETATTTCSVALLRGEATLAARVLPPETKAAKFLAPAVRDVLAEAGQSLAEVTALAVDVGPGSFTGLRVGIGLAKGIAYTRDLPVYGVLSLDALAEQARNAAEQARTTVESARSSNDFATALDAYRGQIFVKTYRASDETSDFGATVVDLDDWLSSQAGSLPLFGQVPKARLKDIRERGLFLPGGDQAVPDAAAVGRLAARRIAAGHPPDDVFALLPVYLRKSAAEEKAEEKNAEQAGS